MNEQHVGIIGAGTMGAGIAQIAAQSGWTVHLSDVDDATVQKSIDGVAARFDRLVEKKRMTKDERDAAARRLQIASSPDDFANCELVIEAIVEKMDAKVAVLSKLLPVLDDDAIIATNTSSLSVTELGAALGESRRTVGMHFFNPAPLMKLVEVIAGSASEPQVVDRTAEIAQSWGKNVARAADVPGFIVNHVARPYYLEAFRILEDGYAAPRQIDDAMKTIGGFRMGPLELTDLIGQDVNTATTRSVWEQLDKPPLLTPNAMQESLAANGALGRKAGRGVYEYGDSEPTASLEVDQRELEMSDELRDAVDAFVAHAVEGDDDAAIADKYVFARILAAIITQAELAHERGVAERDDIDTALQYGVNYPMGPFAWREKIGAERVDMFRDALGATLTA